MILLFRFMKTLITEEMKAQIMHHTVGHGSIRTLSVGHIFAADGTLKSSTIT